MAYRKRMSKRRSRRDFARKSRPHRRNISRGVARGGFRI